MYIWSTLARIAKARAGPTGRSGLSRLAWSVETAAFAHHRRTLGEFSMKVDLSNNFAGQQRPYL